MKRIWLITLIIIFSGCHRNEKTSGVKQPHSSKLNRKYLLGAWTGGCDPNASFVVKEKAIFYPDQEDGQLRSFKYRFKRDTFTVYYDNYTSTSVVKKLDKDSLVLLSTEDGSILRLGRFKE